MEVMCEEMKERLKKKRIEKEGGEEERKGGEVSTLIWIGRKEFLICLNKR